MRLRTHRWTLVAVLTIAMLALAYANLVLAIQPTDFGWVCEQGPIVAEGIFWTPVSK
ncbi:hypothetical protein [Vulcanisaeta sp. JCM 14467]|uniref:hypothetical protein n=1 Tax=Vulcanisaeta sp. JCM 14467 TaxID=1295370 RepID=UPI000A7CDB8F|nr:hypothetical protein [Vulcanisaeta sp. JCM 14467]